MGSESAKQYNMKMPILKPLKLIPVMIGVLVLVGCAQNSSDRTSLSDNLLTSDQNIQSSVSSLTEELQQLTDDELLSRTLWKFAADQPLNFSEITCDDCLNKELANETVTYVSEQYGIQFDVPYNKRWGNADYRILPYQEHEQSILFGPLVEFENGWIPLYKLDIVPKRSYDEIQANVFSTFEKKTINGFDVAEYSTVGMCDVEIVEVLGSRNNYQFYPVCDSQREQLEKVIQTLETSLDEQVFDDCGKADKYQDESWYENFIEAFNNAIGDGKQVEELCYAPGDNLVVFAQQAVYCGESQIGRYDVVTNSLEIAEYTNSSGGECSARPTVFGKRVGNVIKMTGSNGDAGCGTDITFDYDYLKNEYRKTSANSYCYDGLSGEKTSESWNYY